MPRNTQDLTRPRKTSKKAKGAGRRARARGRAAGPPGHAQTGSGGWYNTSNAVIVSIDSPVDTRIAAEAAVTCTP